MRPEGPGRLTRRPGKAIIYPGMNFAELIVGKMTEVYQTVHMRELTDVPELENDQDRDDPTEVFTDIHFWGRLGSVTQAAHGCS